MQLNLFNGFVLRHGGQNVAMPLNSQRLIALVTLRTRLTRDEARGILWPEVPESRACARLRTALWRLRGARRDVLRSDQDQLLLDEGVDVDLKRWLAVALMVIDRPDSVNAVGWVPLRPCGDLLPGWYDDWVLLERERVRQLQLHVLETAADQLLLAGRPAAALELALGALHMEQTRESAHRLVVRIHLAEGNRGEARRQFERCRSVLAREIGVGPSAEFRSML
jgi:DNA-binding SARP family transcriptional activator